MTALRSSAATLLAAVLTASLASAQGAIEYGKPLTLKEQTPISAILRNPKAYEGKRVQVEGMIVEVCEDRGCWIRIAGSNGAESIRFKVEDGVITFPVEAKGKMVLAEGVLTITNLTKEQAIAQAKEMARERGTLATFDSSRYTGPVTHVQIAGEGARIK